MLPRAGIAIALQQHITNEADAKRRHHRNRHNSGHPMSMAEAADWHSSSSSSSQAGVDPAAAAAEVAAERLEAAAERKRKREQQPSAWESIKVRCTASDYCFATS
jgi:hypothetical protein